MEEGIFLSIIVKVCNDQFCLKNCVDSLAIQNGNFEILLLDDGSKDESRKICDDLCKTYADKVRVFCVDSEKDGDSLNLGIKNAKGKFVSFVRPKDSVSSNYVSSIENYIRTHNCDLTVFNYFNAKKYKYNMHAQNLPIFEGVNDDPTDKIVDLLLVKNDLNGFIFNRVYKLDIIRKNNIKFLAENEKTDFCRFDMQYATFCEKLFATNDVIYTYYEEEFIKECKQIENLEAYNKLYFDLKKYILIHKKEAQSKYLSFLNDAFLKEVVYILEENRACNQKKLLQKLKSLEIVNTLLQTKFKDPISRNLKARLRCLIKNEKLLFKLRKIDFIIIKIFRKINNYLNKLKRIYINHRRDRLIRKYKNKEIKNRVVFICFTGKQYSGNPRAISEKLHELSPKTKLVWLFKKPRKFKAIAPKYVKKVKYSTKNKIKYLATSRIWVDNNQLVCDGDLLPRLKRKENIFIETWHGDRGIKRSFYSLPNCYRAKFSVEYDGVCDYFLSGSLHTEKLNKEMFHYKGDHFKIGCPRNDILINDHSKVAERTRKELGIPEDHKILIYAPTFREDSGAPKGTLNFKRLLSKLKEKYNCEWTIITKGHHRANGEKISNSKYVKDCSDYYDIANLLTIADLLITDFSSVAGDCVLANVLPILYINDFDNYVKYDRGVLFDLGKSPFLIAKDQNDLEKIIMKLTPEKIQENCKSILKFYGAYETGHATDDVCSVILDKLNKK